MVRRILTLAAAPVIALVLAMPGPAGSCVGKTLVIGSVSSPNVSLVSEMMSILITERTGTTVVTKYYDDFSGCYEAVSSGEVDIMVDFTGRCYVEVLGQSPSPDADKVFSEVKEVFQRDKNLVWLEPLGFSDSALTAGDKGGDTPAHAAPVVRKDTLNKFPALPRVINKLAGRLDNGTVSGLVEQVGGQDNEKKRSRRVTRKFLKDKRLI